MLIVETIEHRQLLLSMSRIGSGIEINDDMRGLFLSRAYKQIDQKIIDRVNAFDLSATHFKNDVAFLHGFLRFAPSERVQKPIDGRATGERFVFLTRVFAHNGFEQRIVSQQLRVVAVRIAREYLIDLLSQDVFDGLGARSFRSWIGQSSRRFRQDAEFLIQLANREQACIADDLATVKCHRDLLPSHFKKLQLRDTLCLRHRSAFRAC